MLIDRYQDGENAGYPTLCKGRYLVDGERYHALEEPTSLDTLEAAAGALAARYRLGENRRPPASPSVRQPGGEGVASGN
ncbi:hypothetical protein ACNKHQ_18330 [Shigella flexneri]